MQLHKCDAVSAAPEVYLPNYVRYDHTYGTVVLDLTAATLPLRLYTLPAG